MKHLLVYGALFSFFACSQPAQNTENQSVKSDYSHFVFSDKLPATMVADPANWCAGGFDEVALVGADPKNFFRRLFALSNIPGLVTVDYGHLSATFMLHPKGNEVAILTSDNLPACLSNKANFFLAPDGLSFEYNNKRDIQFIVYLQSLPNGMQIALDLPKDAGHGLGVVRCAACK